MAAAEVTEHLEKSDRAGAIVTGACPLPPGPTGNRPAHDASVGSHEELTCNIHQMDRQSTHQMTSTESYLHCKVFNMTDKGLLKYALMQHPYETQQRRVLKQRYPALSLGHQNSEQGSWWTEELSLITSLFCFIRSNIFPPRILL